MRQLADQVEQSNQWLVQLNAAEENVSKLQEEQKVKQASLGLAIQTCDTLRYEKQDLQRKVDISDGEALRLRGDASQSNVERQILAKKLQGVEKVLQEAKDEKSQLSDMLEDSIRKLDIADTEQARLQNALQNFSNEETKRMDRDRDERDSLSRQLAECKASFHALAGKEGTQRSRVTDLEKLVEQLKFDSKERNEELAQAKSREAKLEEDQRHLHLLEAQFKSDLHNEQSRATRTQQQVEAAQELAECRQADLNNAREECDKLAHANRVLQDEVRKLNQDVDGLGGDLMEQANSRAGEKDRMETKIRQLQSDLGKLATDARERERHAMENAQTKQAEHVAERKSLEDQCGKLQNEQRRLHDMLQRVQNELEDRVHQHQMEIDEADARVGKTQEKLREAEVEVSAKEAEGKREKAALLAEIQRLHNEIACRSADHVERMGHLHSALQQISAECQDLQDSYNTAKQEVESLRAEFKDGRRAEDASLRDLYQEAKHAIGDLAQANNQTRQENEQLTEENVGLEVQRDEEHARTIVLKEEVGRLQEELGFINKKLAGSENASKERLDHQRQEYESALADKGDASRRLGLVVSQLEESNAQNRALQEERQRASTSLSDAQSRYNTRVASLEDQLAEAERRYRSAVGEKEAIQADRKLIKTSVEGSASTIASLQKQISMLENERSESNSRDKTKKETQEEQLMISKDTSRKYQTQLQQTKSLLKVVQDQRKHLQEDNIALRAELDDVLRKSLIANGHDREPRIQIEKNYIQSPNKFISSPKMLQPNVEHRHYHQNGSDGIQDTEIESPNEDLLDIDIEKLRQEVESLQQLN